MKVKDLKNLLAVYPDDFDVVLARDAEGNTFSPIFCVDSGFYKPNSSWSGRYTAEDELAMQKGDPLKNNAVCMWPVN